MLTHVNVQARILLVPVLLFLLFLFLLEPLLFLTKAGPS